MAISPKSAAERCKKIDTAWETNRKDKKFAGFSLAQFRVKTKLCADLRTRMEANASEQVTLRELRTKADKDALESIRLIVNAVKADETEGEDGEFYTALGYVRRSERKSGLSRKAKATATTSKA